MTFNNANAENVCIQTHSMTTTMENVNTVVSENLHDPIEAVNHETSTTATLSHSVTNDTPQTIHPVYH